VLEDRSELSDMGNREGRILHKGSSRSCQFPRDSKEVWRSFGSWSSSAVAILKKKRSQRTVSESQANPLAYQMPCSASEASLRHYGTLEMFYYYYYYYYYYIACETQLAVCYGEH